MGDKADKYKSLGYPVLLQRAGEDFVLVMPELGCTASDPDLAEAWRKLQEARTQYTDTMVELGREKEIRPPRASEGMGPMLRSLMSFSIKTAVVVAAVLVCTWLLAGSLERAGRSVVDGLFGQVRQMGITSLGQRARDELYQIRQRIENLTPQEREQLRTEVAMIVRQLKPLVAELRPLWEEPQATAPPAPPAKAGSGPPPPAAGDKAPAKQSPGSQDK